MNEADRQRIRDRLQWRYERALEEWRSAPVWRRFVSRPPKPPDFREDGEHRMAFRGVGSIYDDAGSLLAKCCGQRFEPPRLGANLMLVETFRGAEGEMVHEQEVRPVEEPPTRESVRRQLDAWRRTRADRQQTVWFRCVECAAWSVYLDRELRIGRPSY